MSMSPSKLSMMKFRDLCREHTREAIETIVKMMKGGEEVPANVQLSAAIHILDRGFGKPSQSVELSGKDGDPLFADKTSDEIRADLRRRLSDPQVLQSIGVAADLVQTNDTRPN